MYDYYSGIKGKKLMPAFPLSTTTVIHPSPHMCTLHSATPWSATVHRY